MLETNGNIWKFRGPNNLIVIPTNGTVNSQGKLVMGAGVAKQATQLWPLISYRLGDLVKRYGNHVHILADIGVCSFPVKHAWSDTANIMLITRSCGELVASTNLNGSIYLPRVGCGNGHLLWQDVKPILESYLDDRFILVSI